MNPSNKKFTSMFILLVWLFVFVFFTQNIYSSFMDKKETFEKNKADYESKIKLREDLNKLSIDLKSNNSDKKLNSEIKKYLQEYSEDKIIKLFYNFAETYAENWQTRIKSISFTKWVKNEIWLKEATINISAIVSNKKVMNDFLYFVVNNPDYKFLIHSFTYPKDTDKPFLIQIPIKILYQDFKKND